MKPTWKLLSLVLVLALLAACGAPLVLEARAQGQRSTVRWEYAWVDFPSRGVPVFASAKRAVPLPADAKWLCGAAALDVPGREGWEAVGIVPVRNGVKVLLKRPA